MSVALDGLNRAQEAAVAHRDGPLVVVAGAGTGKTQTVVRRFAWLVDEGLPAERILALTFSAPAAADLRERESARLYADHDRLLAERGALDYGDLVLRAFQLLHERPHVRERVARRFRHV